MTSCFFCASAEPADRVSAATAKASATFFMASSRIGVVRDIRRRQFLPVTELEVSTGAARSRALPADEDALPIHAGDLWAPAFLLLRAADLSNNVEGSTARLATLRNEIIAAEFAKLRPVEPQLPTLGVSMR